MSSISAGKVQVDNLTVQGLGAGAIQATNLKFNNLDVSGNLTLQGAPVATQAFVSSAVSGVIGSAGAALDTLGEIQAALGNDANLASTLTNSIATKAPLANPTFTGAVSAPTLAVTGNETVAGNLDVSGNVNFSNNLNIDNKIFSNFNDSLDAFCSPYPSGPYAVSRFEFAKMNAQILTAAPWSETLCSNTYYDPVYHNVDSSSYVSAVPLNDSSYNFDSSGVKFPGNYYFKDPVTQLQPCSAPLPVVYTVYAPVNGAKAESSYYSNSLNAGKFNFDDFIAYSVTYNIGGNPATFYAKFEFDKDIGSNSIYRRFLNYNFSTLSDLSTNVWSTGISYLQNIQSLQATPLTNGSITTTLLQYVFGKTSSAASPLSANTKDAIYAIISGSDNYLNLKNSRTWSDYSPCSDIKDSSGIYKATFDFTRIIKTGLPVVFISENIDTPSTGSNYLCESLASYGIIVVSCCYLYSGGLMIRRTTSQTPQSILDLAKSNTPVIKWVARNAGVSVNNKHLFYKNLPNSGSNSDRYLYNVRTVDSDWAISSLNTATDIVLDLVNTLKTVKSTVSSGSLGDYINFLKIGQYGSSGSTMIGAALNLMSTNPAYNTTIKCGGFINGFGMMLCPFNFNDQYGQEIISDPTFPAYSIGRKADRLYSNGFNIPTMLFLGSIDNYAAPPIDNTSRNTVGSRKYIQEAVQKTNYLNRANIIAVEGWNTSHVGATTPPGYFASCLVVPSSATGYFKSKLGVPNYNDEIYSIPTMSVSEHFNLFSFYQVELYNRFFRFYLNKDIAIETILSLPFDIDISPWTIKTAEDSSWAYQQYDFNVGGAGTLTVPYQKNQIQVNLKNGSSIMTMGTDTSGNNPNVSIGNNTTFNNTSVTINGITMTSSQWSYLVNTVLSGH